MPWFINHAYRVEIIHTAEQLPLGPYAGGIPGSAATDAEDALWHGLDGIISVSKTIEKYAAEHCGLMTEMIPNHPWVYKDKDTLRWPRRRENFSKQRVAMINPAWVKGYDIFLEMAKVNHERYNRSFIEREGGNHDEHSGVYEYVAYATWGSSKQMEKELEDAGVR